MLERRIEEASLASWPALEQVELGGWRLRFAGGYTKRANSVTPLPADSEGLERRVEECERMYRSRGLPPVFRLPRPFAPPALDALLERRGYVPADRTRVMHLDPAGFARPLSPEGVMLREAELEGWLELFSRLGGATPERNRGHGAILEASRAPRLLAVLETPDGPACCGLGVLSDGCLGVFDVVTDRGLRGRGYGTALTATMLEWGRSRGAEHAYLQVVATNATAIRLYERLGFRDLYDYWYRIAPE